MTSVLERGMRLLSRWRRPKPRAALRTYLTTALAAEPFTDEAVASAPTAPGVYLLYRSGRLIYVGVAVNGSGIREALQSHRHGAHGACTQAATAFDFEITARPAEAHRAYLREHMARYGGRLPPCNQGLSVP